MTDPPPKPATPRGIEPRLRRAAQGGWTWRFRVRWRDSATGRRLVEEFDTVDDALDFQAQLRLGRRRGALAELDRGRISVREFVAREWWPKDAGRNLERSTLTSYKIVYNLHLLPRVGRLELRQLAPPVVQTLREDLEADGIGAPTIRRAMAILQAICRYAVAKGEIASNPVKEVRKPRVKRRLAIIAISPQQVERLRAQLDVESAALISLLGYEGLRPEEALALEDAKLGRASILIDQKNVDGVIVSGQKTDRPPRSPQYFKTVRKDVADHRFAASRPPGCTLLFARADGEPWREYDYRNWRRRVFRPAVKRAGLPITRPYDLRHACASLLLHAGWPLTEVADHLGHSVDTLARDYAHVIAELKGKRPVSVDVAIARARGKRPRKKAA